jgi:hypothetical protein
MSIIDRLSSTEQTETTGYEAAEITPEVADALTTSGKRQVISVRPHKDNGGIPAMENVLESLYSVETESPMLSGGETNVSPAHSFEMRYTQENENGSRVASINYLPGSGRLEGTLKRQLQTQYPDSLLERTSSDLIPEVDVEGRYVAGATLQLRRYSLYPIKNIDLPGFDTDPTGSILEEMVGAQDEDQTDAEVIVQVMFKPALRDWTEGVENGFGIADDADGNIRGRGTPSIKDLTHNLRQPTYEKKRRLFTRETIEHPPSKVDKDVARLLEEQQGDKGWRLCLRVLAISDEEQVAIDRASHTASMFRNFYENAAEQTFLPNPLGENEVLEEARKVASREWEDHGIVKSQREVAGIVNVPEEQYVNTNKMQWSMSKPGEGIPPGTPRFSYEKHGVAGASREAKAVAMMDVDDPTDPYWYGFGKRHNIEAGVEPDILNVHQFVGGATGKGKTTLLKNFFYQIMNRGHGGLFFDPKGRDADDILSVVPDKRKDDVVFVDIGGDHDKQIGFNFLEPPVEQGEGGYSAAIESMGDDLKALLAQAGGSDNYWGALMERVAGNLARGFGKSPWNLTILDMYYALEDEEARTRYAEHLSDERISFIEDYAKNHLAEMEDDKLEPLLGRLQQWVENDVIRDLIAHPESTISVEEIVNEGKIIIVRNQTSSDTVKRMFATALIRRTWVAVRENPDAPPFFGVIDEFDSIVTEESNIHSILSEARAFEFSLTLACQNPSSQLPQRVADAIQNQCQTFLSFNPGGPDDAKVIADQHSRDVEYQDLTNMSKYHIYMRTHDDTDQLTHSYKVKAFPPLDELNTDIAREDDETEQLIDDLLERHGERRRTDEEIKQDTRFHPAEGDDTPGVGERETMLLAKAALDESIRRDDTGLCGWVPRDAFEERVRDEVGDISLGQLWDIIDRTDEIAFRDDDENGEQVRCTDDGRRTIFATGGEETSGGPKHRKLLKDSYAALTKLGVSTDLPEQEGGSMPDGYIDPERLLPDIDDLSPLDAASAIEDVQESHPVVTALTDLNRVRLEAESHSSSKPAQTIKNLQKAVEAEEKCVFVAREDDAKTVRNTLNGYYSDTDEDGNHILFNRRPVVIDGETMLRPDEARETVWKRDPETGDIMLEDSAGTRHATFESPEAVFSDAEQYPGTESTVVDEDEWRTVYEPYIPEVIFDEEPSEDDWEIIVVPSEADSPDDLSLIVGDDLDIPLTAIGEGDESNEDAEPSDEETETSENEADAENEAENEAENDGGFSLDGLR